MRLEHLPILLGVLVAIAGIGLLADAWSEEGVRWSWPDRRRRERADRHRGGEALVGLGTICMGAALIGRDTWRWGNLAVIAGTILIVAGAVLNARFLKETLFFRGPARRQPEREPREPGDPEAEARAGTPPAGE